MFGWVRKLFGRDEHRWTATFSDLDKAWAKENMRREIFGGGVSAPLPNTTHRPPRAGADIDHTGSVARKPKPRKRKTAAKSKKRR